MRWSKRGFGKVFEVLAAEADNEYAQIDSTIVRAHQHSAGAKKVIPECIVAPRRSNDQISPVMPSAIQRVFISVWSSPRPAGRRRVAEALDQTKALPAAVPTQEQLMDPWRSIKWNIPRSQSKATLGVHQDKSAGGTRLRTSLLN